MQRFLALPLILALLACPLNCMGALQADAGEASEQVVQEPTSCGGCCHSPPAAPQVPETPPEECPCPTCLCSGAVLLDDAAAFDFLGTGELTLACVATLVPVDVTLQTCSKRGTDDPLPLPTGRAARILHQSFLL